ncbi:transglutaminaseTgpA domain-containing protein [Plantactinospora sp. WMMB782]|uniref:transglutaminaseTgpA domain-containing protein n=1 Tax=Plantactinospora sp. WMMB782 TaxID=3404121 RepID=UPI003B930D48
MSGRHLATTGTALAAAVAGMAFTPVFGFRALLLPVGLPVVSVLATVLAVTRLAPLRDWRAPLATLAGLLVIVEVLLWPTTHAGVPTGRTLDALVVGLTDSWRLTLQSTWPARPDPAQVLFVPVLVVLAAVFGAEIVHRVTARLPALLPSLGVLVLAQLYAALTPAPAALTAAAYVVAAGAVLTGTVRGPAVAAVTGVVVATVAAMLVPAGPARFTLRQAQSAPVPQTQLTSPLDEIAYRLGHPDSPVFRVRCDTWVDRWTLVVFDEFDGVNWSQSGRYRRLGSDLPPGPEVTASVRRRSAELDVTGTGPWLPSQTWPARVTGAAPLVAEGHGTLLLPQGTGPTRYDLQWWQPETTAGALADAAVDGAATSGLGGLGDTPEAMTLLATEAVRGLRPSMRAALVLEDWFRRNYRLAVGQSLPTGSAWPQLADFLLTSRRGTSEQFAAAYVALARIQGIPARLAVGYRMPAGVDTDGWYTVRNGDVLAWPEVAVRGVGWVPLDPAGAAARAGGEATGLAARTEQARSQLPTLQDLRDPPVVPSAPGSGPGRGGDGRTPSPVPWPALLVLPVLPLLVWPVVVPAAWAFRSWRRRRRDGLGAVAGAVAEVRDRLRAHGVAVSPGMTVRDLGTAAGGIVDQATGAAIGELRTIVDAALWSGARDETAPDRAWAAVRVVRAGLARRGTRVRLRAALDLAALWPPRQRGAGQRPQTAPRIGVGALKKICGPFVPWISKQYLRTGSTRTR